MRGFGCRKDVATADHITGIEAQRNSPCSDKFSLIKNPPTTGPRIEPKRPMPYAHPAPVARTYVGYIMPGSTSSDTCAPIRKVPAKNTKAINKKTFSLPKYPMEIM